MGCSSLMGTKCQYNWGENEGYKLEASVLTLPVDQDRVSLWLCTGQWYRGSLSVMDPQHYFSRIKLD